MSDTYFKRNAYNDLIKWKNNPHHKPLLVRGLRQTGKTTLVTEFAKNNYKSVFFLDFRKDKSIHQIFDGDFNIDDITFNITIKYPNIRLIPHDTVFIFDEIQDCPNARSSLKYFSLDGRYDVIATGSMLGIKNYRISKEESRGIPVGFEDYLELKPLNYEEFVMATGINKTLDEIFSQYIDNNKQIPDFIHNQFLDLYRKYACVGGMPEVVNSYLSTKDFSVVKDIQKRIINNYEADFGTHLNDRHEIIVDSTAKERIFATFHSIPRQLAKENQKFQYSVITKKAKSREYETSIEWLEDYGLISLCKNLTTLERPLESYVDDSIFKVFINDPGLYLCLLNDPNITQELINNSLGMSKGAIYENLISCSFNSLGINQYYFHKNTGLEIDFISILNNQSTLIEVKATSGKTKSADFVLSSNKYNVNQMIKFSAANIGVHGNKKNYPYYLADLILKQ